MTAYKNLGEVLFASGKLDAWRANFLRFEAACPQALPLAVQALEVCQHFADFERLEHYLDGLRNERYTARTPSSSPSALEELLYLLLFFDVEPRDPASLRADLRHDGPGACTARRWRAPERGGPGDAHRLSVRGPAQPRDGQDDVGGDPPSRPRAVRSLLLFDLHARTTAGPQRFRDGVDHFVSIASLRDAAAVERIAADDLDILVDLSTHTRGARPAILARKPARVQLTHVASAGAVGLSAIDFKLTDHFADVPENQAHVDRAAAADGGLCLSVPAHRARGGACLPTRARSASRRTRS